MLRDLSTRRKLFLLCTADFIVNERQRLAGVLTPAEIKALTDRVGEFKFESALHCLSGIAARLSLDLEAK